MAISGQQKEVKEFVASPKYMGFFKGTVVAINPSADKLSRLLGEDVAEDSKIVKYVDTKDGVDVAYIRFWMEVDGREGLYLNHTILLENQISRSKAGDKIELVNCVGDNSWIEADEDNEFNDALLWDKFKNFVNTTGYKTESGEIVEKWEPGSRSINEIIAPKNYRPALKGEAELLNFLKIWLSDHGKGINLNNIEANLLLNTDKLFQGDFSELQLTDQPFAAPVVGLAYVSVDAEDNEKHYQRIWREFLPAKFLKNINNGEFASEYDKKRWDKFVAEVEGQHGITGHYALKPLSVYDPTKDVQTSLSAKAGHQDPTEPLF